MRWTPGGTSEDIEDRRGDDSSGGGGGGIGFGGMHLGLGGTLVLLVLSFVFRTNLFQFVSTDSGAGAYTTPNSGAPRETAPGEEHQVQFVSFVLDDVQRTWDQVLPQAGAQYRHAKLVLFREITRSACGTAESATGPFYCPGDEKVYIDLAFYDELTQRCGAPGEFAQAYVLAHEIGHHVQKLLGIESKVRQLQSRNPGAEKALSVRMELQADCLAGVWANATQQRNIIDQNDVESGLGAAAAVGDDHIQRMSGRSVSPESFTHGSSAQRMQWFKNGLQSGDVGSCNTFAQR
jgi:predicted metalloprotease